VRVAGKVDTRWLLGFGFIFAAVGCAMQAWVTTIDDGFWTFAAALVIVGVGASLLFTPLSIAVLGATTPQEGPAASAMVNLSLQLGGSITIAALDVVIDRSWSAHSQALGANITMGNPVVQQVLAGGGSVAGLANTVNQQASILAYSDATYAIAVIAVCFAPLIFLMRKPKTGGGHAVEAG
jgi:DHA2 family multidrug resistance protein